MAMERSEYEQLIVRLDYVDMVCDELLMSKVFVVFGEDDDINNDLYDNRKGKMYLEMKKLTTKIKEEHERESQQYINKLSMIEKQLDQNKQYRKRLKEELYDLSQSIEKTEENNKHLYSRNLLTLSSPSQQQQKLTNNKYIRQQQLSSLEQELQNEQKLLNTQMKGYNAIEESKIEINEGLANLEKRENELTNKLTLLNKQEKSYIQCVKLEVEYESLLKDKRCLLNKLETSEIERDENIENKSTAINQSNENLKEMSRYYEQLQSLIIEQKFIIDEIESREVSNAKRLTKNKLNSSNGELIMNSNEEETTIENDGDKMFEEEIEELKKTIANRRFIKRKQLKAINKLSEFINTTTNQETSVPIPENNSIINNLNSINSNNNNNNRGITTNNSYSNNKLEHHHKKREDRNNIKFINENNKSNRDNYESIFKIEIEPISHSSPVNVRSKNVDNNNHNNNITNNNNHKEQEPEYFNQNLLSYHRNSMPSKLTKIEHKKITDYHNHNHDHVLEHHPLFNNKRQYNNNNNNNNNNKISTLKSKSDNKINNISSNEISVLERILKDKEKYIEMLLSKGECKEKYYENKQIGSNSRLIEKLIEEKNNKINQTKNLNRNSLEHISNNNNHTPNSNNPINVRIRTKRSESEKINRLNELNKKKRVGYSCLEQEERLIKKDREQLIEYDEEQQDNNNTRGGGESMIISKDINNHQQQKEEHHQSAEKQLHHKEHEHDDHYEKRMAITQPNEEPSTATKEQHYNNEQQQQLQNNNKKYHKYNYRINEFLENEKESIDNVFKKIEEIKYRQSQNQTINRDNNNNNNNNKEKPKTTNPKQESKKIKIFKLTNSGRKYSNSLSFYRKGIAPEVEVGDSSDVDGNYHDKEKSDGESYKMLEEKQIISAGEGQIVHDDDRYRCQQLEEEQQQHNENKESLLERILEESEESIRNTLLQSVAKIESNRY